MKWQNLKIEIVCRRNNNPFNTKKSAFISKTQVYTNKMAPVHLRALTFRLQIGHLYGVSLVLLSRKAS